MANFINTNLLNQIGGRINNRMNNTVAVTKEGLDLILDKEDSLAGAISGIVGEIGTITIPLLNIIPTRQQLFELLKEFQGTEIPTGGTGLITAKGYTENSYDMVYPLKPQLHIRRGESNTGGIGFNHYKYSLTDSIKVAEYTFQSTSFLDYPPYRTCKISLPFVGVVDIDLNTLNGKTMNVYLTYDATDCTGVYTLTYKYNSQDVVFAEHEFRFGVDIPVGASNIGDIKRNLLLSGITTAITLGSGLRAISLPPQTTTKTGTVTQSRVREYDIWGSRKAKNARPKRIKFGTDTTDNTTTYDTTVTRNKPVDKTKPWADALSSSVDSLNKTYGGQNTAGKQYSSTLALSPNKIMLIFYTKNTVNRTTTYNKYNGRPLGEYKVLGYLTGYTEISDVHIEANTAMGYLTQYELDLLEQELYKGIIL